MDGLRYILPPALLLTLFTGRRLRVILYLLDLMLILIRPYLYVIQQVHLQQHHYLMPSKFLMLTALQHQDLLIIFRYKIQLLPTEQRMVQILGTLHRTIQMILHWELLSTNLL